MSPSKEQRLYNAHEYKTVHAVRAQLQKAYTVCRTGSVTLQCHLHASKFSGPSLDREGNSFYIRKYSPNLLPNRLKTVSFEWGPELEKAVQRV